MGLEHIEAALLERAVDLAADRLVTRGYRGPFGIDCWRWRDREGLLRFHPLGEINARLTFGIVARALVDRVLPGGGEGSRLDSIRLALGSGLELRARESAGAAVVPLLLPGPEDDRAAWLELEGAR
jgi:hypothetical protein